MICGRKLSAERTASHAKHCKAPSGYNGSQFMLLNSDEIKVEKPAEEEAKKEEPKKEEEEAPHSPNPFDNPSESEEEEPKKKEEAEEAPHSPNPFDNPSESEEEEEKKEAVNVAAEVLPVAVHEEKEKEVANPSDVSSSCLNVE